MILFYIPSIIISVLYIYLILKFLNGWEKISEFKANNSTKSGTFISIIIAFRNEEKNLPILFESLLIQNLDSTLFEVILINDHSTDNSYQICQNLVNQYQNYSLLNQEILSGKKNAIRLGIENAKGELIVTTDADCIHHKNWLKTILDFYQTNKPKMIIGPVLMKSDNFFEKIQALDFYSLMASGAGAAGNKKPIMCNGANLVFEKKYLLGNTDILNINYISGDDIFLMLDLKKKDPSDIKFLKSNDAVVYTTSEPTFSEFFNQRKRWTSKSKGYKDKDIIFVAILVLLMNLNLFLSLISMFFIHHVWILFAAIFILKSMVDYSFLKKTIKFFIQQKLMRYFIPAQVFNIIIIPIIVISAIFTSFTWKGRTFVN